MKELIKEWKQFIKESKEILSPNNEFSNWVIPDDNSIELEYDVEYKHHIQYDFGDIFPTFNSFKNAVKNGKIISLTESLDRNVENRSRTKDMQQLKSLVSSYRSWPQYRNEKTLQAIVDGFKKDKPMKMPFILEYEQNQFYIMSGNTRLDIAFMMNIVPKVIIIKGY